MKDEASGQTVDTGAATHAFDAFLRDDALLKVRDLSVRYRRGGKIFVAVDGVSFDVALGNARPRRRVGQRQDDHRPCPSEASAEGGYACRRPRRI